jgi:hypothetical protein
MVCRDKLSQTEADKLVSEVRQHRDRPRASQPQRRISLLAGEAELAQDSGRVKVDPLADDSIILKDE